MEGGELRSSAPACSWACSMCARVELREWRRRNEAHRSIILVLVALAPYWTQDAGFPCGPDIEIWSGECFHGPGRCEASS
jgi:hypothetical protein